MAIGGWEVFEAVAESDRKLVLVDFSHPAIVFEAVVTNVNKSQ